MIKLVVFDLYNTLIKVEKRNYFFKHVYQKSSNLKSKYSIKEYQNLLMTRDLNRLLSEFPDEVLSTYNNSLFKLRKELDTIRCFNGVSELLRHLKSSYKLGLISNVATPYKMPFYDLGLSHFFDEVIFSCDVGIQKPDKRIYKIMENRTGFQGEEILMVGDSMKSDYEGSISVGWKGLRVVNSKVLKSKYEISSGKDLLKFLNEDKNY